MWAEFQAVKAAFAWLGWCQAWVSALCCWTISFSCKLMVGLMHQTMHCLPITKHKWESGVTQSQQCPFVYIWQALNKAPYDIFGVCLALCVLTPLIWLQLTDFLTSRMTLNRPLCNSLINSSSNRPSMLPLPIRKLKLQPDASDSDITAWVITNFWTTYSVSGSNAYKF